MATNEREINGKTYKFKMTRKGIRAAEAQGFRISTVSDAPMSGFSYLWYASLYAAHPMAFDKACDLLDSYLDDPTCGESVSDLLNELVEEYGKIFE